MDKLFKGRKQKGSNAVTSVPLQNASSSTEQFDLPIERIDWAVEIAGIVKDFSEASPLLAPLKATCLLIIRGLEVAREMHQTRLDLQEITEFLQKQEKDMEEFVVRLEGGDMKGSPVLQAKVEIYLENIHEALAETTAPVKETKRQRFDLLRRARPTTSTQEEIPNIKQKLNSSYQDFMDAALLIASEKVEERAYLAIRMHEVSKRAEILNQQEQVEQLEDAPECDYDSPLPLLYGQGIPCCQPGTRTAILADINQWAMATGTKKKIYWLNDAAGTGKTTVAATCARDWQVKRTLAGRFFFTPNSEASSGIDRFCITVAEDIAFLVPSLDGVITTSLDELSNRRCGFHEQFERLIVKPLHSLKPSYPLVLIFDALDTCDPDGRRILLSCLLEHLPGIAHVKVLLTSRPSPDIVGILSKSTLVSGQDVQLLDINDDVRADVRMYIHSTLTRLEEQEREMLVGYSGGLFIVAATACRMLRLSAEPKNLLNKLLTADTKDHLDELYLEVLRQAVWNGGAHDKMMNVLQIIIVTFQPVSINTIAYILSAKFDVGKFVQDLGAVLKDGHPERPIKVLHPTFREFLVEFDRANGFLVNTPSSHALTAIGCLDALEKSLAYDVLQLCGTRQLLPRNADIEDSSKKVTTITTAAVRYASSYWAYHVAASLDNSDVWLKALTFLSTKLLNWIELMSWRGCLGDCVRSLSELRLKALPIIGERRTLSESPDAVKIIHAYQFLLQHQPLIQASALHTYSAALAFTPQTSPLFENYRREYISKIPRIITTGLLEWTINDVLTGHSRHLRQVEFSPDGSRLATRSLDSSVILWDTTSGAIVGHPFYGGAKDNVEYLSFSSDGHKLVFATASSSIYVWDSLTGQQALPTIDTGSGELVQVEFTPHLPYIVSASAEPRDSRSEISNVLRLWSASTGTQEGPAIKLDGRPRYFAVSPDGLRVACVSRHPAQWEAGRVTLWSLDSSALLSRYDMPVVYHALCVVYSPEGSRFVTWDQAGTLYFREGTTGDEIVHVKVTEEGLVGAIFSPNGSILATYGNDTSIVYLWDAASGDLTLSLSGHTKRISYISFAQDGCRLASISLDQTVLVWDVFTGAKLGTLFPGYTGNVSRPRLSPDWNKLVTVSVTHQINLYDVNAATMSGKAVREATLDLAPPNVAFSRNGDVMVCGYLDLNDRSTLGLWSTATSTPVGVPMVGHRGGIISVCFCPNSIRVASVSSDNTLRLWDASTGQQDGDPLTIDDGKYVTFSPDGQFVAACSYRAIYVWNVQKRTLIWSLSRNTDSYLIAFSPKSSKLAGGLDGRICLWDILPESSNSNVFSSFEEVQFNLLAFGPAEDLLATSRSTRIQLWRCLDRLELLLDIPIIPKQGFQLGISFDGRFLAYGSSIWDISSVPETLVSLNSHQDGLELDSKAFPHSLLTYDAGWIYSAYPYGPLMPVPGHLRAQFRVWHAHGQKIIVWNQQRLPVVIDCSPLLP